MAVVLWISSWIRCRKNTRLLVDARFMLPKSFEALPSRWASKNPPPTSSDDDDDDNNEGGEEKGKKPCPTTNVALAEYAPLDQVSITIIGAGDAVAQVMALQLKQNPLIREIRLFDSKSIQKVSNDLKYISTPTRVASFVGDNQIKYALKKADIVVIAGGKQKSSASTKDPMDANACRVRELAFACLRSAPEAIFAIMVEPINSIVPLFAEVFRQNGVFCPNKVLGVMALENMRARTMTANKLGLDPTTVSIHVIGGASPNTMVPIITGARPGGQYLRSEAQKMISAIKNMNETVMMAKKGKPAVVSSGYAAAYFIDIVAKGLCGVEHHPISALVRTSTLDGVKYLATPLQFGLSGVEANLGLPKLSTMEMEMLEDAIPYLQEDISKGEAFIGRLSPSTMIEYVAKIKKEVCPQPPC